MDSELYDAVTNDEVDVLKELEGRLSVGDERTPTGSTVLHLACHYGSMDCVKEILNEYEPLLLKLDSRGETALHLAAREGHIDVVETLISTANSSHLQLENTSSTVIQFLIRLANVEYETALHVAVRNDHYDVIRWLVTQDPSHPHPRNMHDETPLYLACIRGDPRISKAILDHCESPAFGGPEGRTALHAAVMDFPDDSLDILDSFDRNILHVAAIHSQKEVIRFILSQGDRTSNKLLIQRDKEGNTPLHLIAKFECHVQELMDLSTLDWDVLNHRYLTPVDLLDINLSDQMLPSRENTKIRHRLVNDLQSRQNWQLWRTLKYPN